MKKVSFLGHFAFGVDKANGQTIKTKILGEELKRQVGEDQVDFYDTMGKWLFVLKMPFILLHMLRNYQNVVVQPAYKGVRLIVPCLVLLNLFFHRKLHYIVLGGWLPSFVGKYPILRWSLKRLDGMYCETHLIQNELKALGLEKLMYLPNCKQLSILDESELDKLNRTLSVLHQLTQNSRIAKHNRIIISVTYFVPCTDINSESYGFRGKYVTLNGICMKVDGTVSKTITVDTSIIPIGDILKINSENEHLKLI